MLQNIRDNSQGIAAKVIIGLMVGAMGLFGVESIIGGFTNTSVAEVNGEEISEQQLNASIQNIIASLGGSMQDLDEELLRQIALNQIIDDMVLRQSARDSGMIASDESLDQAIINTPQFQINGSFDRDLALRTMGAQGFTPQSYRATLSDRIVIGQLANAYAASAFVTDAEIEQIAALTLQTRDFRYLSVTPGTRTLGEAIPPEDIEAYYEANQDRFIEEEEVAIDYVVLDKSTIFDEVELEPARVRAQYEQERQNSASSAERRAAHILLETGGSRSEAEARELAAEISARLEAGEDFAELALEYSDDVVSAEDGGDIGFTDGSAFPQPLEEALVGLEVGETSGPVVTEFGVHLVKLTEYESGSFPEFEEVAERIGRDLKSAEVEQIYFGRLETLANLAFETGDLRDISEQLELEVQQSDFFTRSGGSSRYTSDPRAIEAAFSPDVLLDGNNSDIIELDDSQAMVLRVREHNEASVRPLEEVRGEIAALLRGQIERQRTRELGEQILAALQAGESVDELVGDAELEWIEADNVRRNQPNVNPEVVQAAFSIGMPDDAERVYGGSQLSNGAYVVIELESVTPGNLSAMSEEERLNLERTIVERAGRSTFDAYLGNLRSSADIRD